LIDAVAEMKRRNPTWGCPRIAQQITALRRNPTTYPKGQFSERSGFWLAWGGEGTRLDEGSGMAGIQGLSDGD
jgi:hypothetical protein